MCVGDNYSGSIDMHACVGLVAYRPLWSTQGWRGIPGVPELGSRAVGWIHTVEPRSDCLADVSLVACVRAAAVLLHAKLLKLQLLL